MHRQAWVSRTQGQTSAGPVRSKQRSAPTVWRVALIVISLLRFLGHYSREFRSSSQFFVCSLDYFCLALDAVLDGLLCSAGQLWTHTQQYSCIRVLKAVTAGMCHQTQKPHSVSFLQQFGSNQRLHTLGKYSMIKLLCWHQDPRF